MNQPMDPTFGTPPRPPSPPPPPPPYGAAPLPPSPSYGTPPPPGYQAYNPAPLGGLRRAGFGSRLGAWLLDYLLYGLLGAALAAPGIVLLFSAFSDCVTVADELVCPPGEPSGGNVALGIALIFAALVAVFVLYVRALGKTGQTWGRKLAGIKVVGDMTGQPIGVGKAIGRQLFASFISGQVLYLGFLWMLWDDNNQTWHDKVVGSIVVDS